MMQAKKIALCAIICLANQAFAHTPNIEDIANTPCGQHDCHCPEELKLAHEQEQLKQLGIDPTLIKALRFVAKKDKQEKLEQDVKSIQKKLYFNGTCLGLGILAALGNFLIPENKENFKSIREMYAHNGMFAFSLIATSIGTFFGIHDYIELSNKKKQLEKTND